MVCANTHLTFRYFFSRSTKIWLGWMAHHNLIRNDRLCWESNLDLWILITSLVLSFFSSVLAVDRVSQPLTIRPLPLDSHSQSRRHHCTVTLYIGCPKKNATPLRLFITFVRLRVLISNFHDPKLIMFYRWLQNFIDIDIHYYKQNGITLKLLPLWKVPYAL